MNPQQPTNNPLEQAPNQNKAFTVLGRFREIGREIDPSKNWGSYPNVGFYSKDENFEMVSGSGKDKLICGIRDLKDPSRKISFEHSFSSKDYVERVSENLANSLGVFSSEKKAQLFIDLNVQLTEFLKNNPGVSVELVDAFLVSQILSHVPDKTYVKDELNVDIMIADFIESRSSNLEKDLEQSLVILQKLLKQVSGKFDPETFRKFMENFSDSSRFLIFDENYNYSKIFKDFWSTPFLSQREKGFQTRIETIPFPTKNQITTQIESKDQTMQLLSQYSFEKIPEVLPAPGASFEEQIVDVNSVVGMSACDSWFIQDIPNSDRGLGNIWKLIQKFKNEDLHFTNESSFIKGIRVNGKIWVYEDGRNRFAALKALGVKQIPMLIIEGQISNRPAVSSII